MTLRLESSPHFEFIRSYLREAGYNEESLCGRLKIADVGELIAVTARAATRALGADELSLLIRLLLLGDHFEKQELDSALGPRVVEALAGLGLADFHPAGGSRMFCDVAVYPVGRVFIASDRWFAVEGKEFQFPEDFVYPAITPNTRELLALLPATPCDNLLELCSGAGAAALAAAEYVQRSWAIDISERSTQMAEFSRLLNGLNNVTVRRGNLYEGVEGRQFERIAAHPPYMPSLQPTRAFADGGADGEQVTRGIVEGLPRFLKPGGCLYCLTQVSDRHDAPLQQRVRTWLGEDEKEFDVAFIDLGAQDPKEAAYIYALKTEGGFVAVDMMRRSLASLGVESLVYGWLVIQRRSHARSVFTVRRSAGQHIGPEEVAWVLNWETFAAGNSAWEEVLEMTPVARCSLELHTIHRMQDGKLAPEGFTLHAEEPFFGDCKVQFWVGYLFPWCDGKASVRQLCATCKSQNVIHAETPPQEFAKLIGALISGGFLEVERFCPPNPLPKQERQRRSSASGGLGNRIASSW